MGSLTKEARDALPSDHFAIPETRDLPIHDERHVRMGWSQIGRTGSLTERQKSEGRRRILRRARELGLDISDWEVHAVAFQLEAMALDIPNDPSHPNRLPFSGVLTRIDEPSDVAPGGATGKRTLIPKAVAEAALSSLLAMGVDCSKDFDEHDSKFKIGVITEASISGNAIHIAGFLYAKDFPQECARIRAEKNRLGFSYECDVAVSDMAADPWVITWCVFTGAAILYKDKAAYRSTSLAAEAAGADSMNPEELKKLNDSIAALTASVATITTDVAAIKVKAAASLGGPVIDQVAPHVAACTAAAASMRAAGVGTHPEHGHVRLLERMAAHMAAEAAQGRVPHVFNDHSYLHAGADASVRAAAEAAAQASETQIKGVTDTLKTVTDGLASVTTIVKDLQAKSLAAGAAPTRRTVSPEITGLLSKIGVSLTAADGSEQKVTVAQVDELLAKAGITGEQKIEAKLKLRAAGVFAPATA
jgi:hypothetical protein